MSETTPKGDELLAVFVDAGRANDGVGVRFQVTPERQASVRHPGFGAGEMLCARGAIEDLAVRGLIVIEVHRQPPPSDGTDVPTGASETWEFDITPQGFEHVDLL